MSIDFRDLDDARLISAYLFCREGALHSCEDRGKTWHDGQCLAIAEVARERGILDLLKQAVAAAKLTEGRAPCPVCWYNRRLDMPCPWCSLKGTKP